MPMSSKVMTLLVTLAVAPCLAQSNLLEITSPASGTIVYPGQVVIISVNADPSVSHIAIAAQDPLGFSATTNGQPLQFQLTIPPNTPISPYTVSAIGTVSNGSLVSSPPISLQVDTRDPVILSGTQPSVLRFEAAGERIPLHVMGVLQDGSELDVTHSIQIKYSSENPQIATVDKDGIVTTVALGSTHIVVKSPRSTYLVNTRVGDLATMSFPGLGSVIPGNSMTFRWLGSNTAQAYRIDAGSTKGGNNYYRSGNLPTTTLSQTINGLPTDGSTIYVTLWTEIGGRWSKNEYFYTASN